jgi:hypothetical protein
MDILLLAITIVSLLIAIFMGIAAWGIWREERARAAARIAILTTAIENDTHPAADAVIHARRVESLEPAFAPRDQAGAESVVRPAPWTPPANWRRVPKAEVAETPLRHEPRLQHEPRLDKDAPATTHGDSFLSAGVPTSTGRQRGLVMAACVLFVVVLTGGYFTIYGTTNNTNDGNSTSQTAAGATTPLELISLRHERQSGALSITGLVRNPSGAERVAKLDAVVFLFDQQGNFVTSARAGVDFTELAPGDESPFVVRIDAPAQVARYRVSFRTEAGVVPHIDRRGQPPIARDLP